MNAQKDTSKLVLRYYWSKLREQKGPVAAVLTVMPFNVLMNQIVPPIILAHVLNRLAKHDFTGTDIWQNFGWELVAYAVLVILGALSWRAIDILQFRIEAKVTKSMAQGVFSHLMNQSARFHADSFGGSLVSQTNKLLGAYIRLADTVTFMVLPMIFGIVFSILVLARIAPLYAFLLFVFSVAFVFCSLIVTRKPRRVATEHAEAESKQTGVLADAITNAMAIKSFSGQRFEERRFERVTDATAKHLFVFSDAIQKQQLVFSTLLSTITASSLFMAVVAVMLFHSNAATVFLIFSYTATTTQQLFTFGNNVIRNFNRSVGDATPMVEILQLQPDVQDTASPEISRIGAGAIEFDDVIFTHNGSQDAIFEGLDLNIRPGEKVGLVGHSGSGKTTLTRLLLRFSDIDGGAIRIDGQNIDAITQDDLRRSIAYVPQEPMLFHRSIRENIAYGQPGSSDKDVERVAKMASAHEFIGSLPKGYDTLVGERGVKLSGGQRQRVAIARAMLKNAPILVLDEATSALDSESEVLIQAALWKLMEGRTAIVIAHRLSTIQKMDRIIVLDNGKIVEEGSHKELVKKKGGTYAKLWAHQSGGFIEE
jgi:ATP-binding cassette subfamily B protein